MEHLESRGVSLQESQYLVLVLAEWFLGWPEAIAFAGVTNRP
jgi:hypothetical protein